MRVNLLVLVLLFSLFSCNPSANNLLQNQIKIYLNTDSSAVIVSGFNPIELEELKKDSFQNYHQLFEVFVKVDEELQDLQKPIEGEYAIKDSILTFKPIKNFKSGNTYLVECYLNSPHADAENSLINKTLPNTNSRIIKQIAF